MQRQRFAHYGFTMMEVYDELVPASVLHTVKKVGTAFPDARFFVSRIREVPDPFLAVTFPGQPFTIIEWWNEPGFKP